MKFTALPVNVGDSFLLEEENIKILVDGGQNQSHIIELLLNRGIKHLSLLICTHYDADHIKGILGIIRSNQIHFDEIWLPELIASTATTLCKKDKEFLQWLNFDNGIKFIHRNLDYEREHEAEKNWFDENKIKSLLTKLSELETPKFNQCELSRRIARRAVLILNFVLAIDKASVSVKWLKFNKNAPNTQLGFHLTLQNSEVSGINILSIESLYTILFLTQINKESLVFLYKEEAIFPSVLFCADSDLAFYGTPKILKNKSIVTAPHHGSNDNSVAYSKVSGKELIFVRSDRKNCGKRPCAEYKNLPKKYCTICKNSIKTEVILIFNGGNWVSPNSFCQC